VSEPPKTPDDLQISWEFMQYRRALITGATSGIGAAFAEALPSGTELLLTGRRVERLAAMRERLGACGRRIDILPADLSQPQGRSAVIHRGIARGIDLLICNAGKGFAGRFIDQPATAHRETLEVNIVAMVELLRGLLPEMLRRARERAGRCGAIILSSTAAFEARPGLACYAASKSFALRLGEAVAAELRGEPIDFLVLCPRAAATQFFARAGLPMPKHAVAPAEIARDALSALGRQTVHCSSGAGGPAPASAEP
jgi:short-subunit dehydrogenase